MRLKCLFKTPLQDTPDVAFLVKKNSDKSEKMGLAMGWIEKKVKKKIVVKKIVTIVKKWVWLWVELKKKWKKNSDNSDKIGPG